MGNIVSNYPHKESIYIFELEWNILILCVVMSRCEV